MLRIGCIWAGLWVAAMGVWAEVPAVRGGMASYEGPVEVEIADDFQGGVSKTIYRFRKDGMEVEAFQNSNEAPHVRCGDVVWVEGVPVGRRWEVKKATVTGRAADDPGCLPVGEQRVAIIVAAFPGRPMPSPAVSDLRAMAFGGDASSMSGWIAEKSYGKTQVAGEVFGPYSLDRSYTCSETTAMREAAIRAADGDIDFRKFQRYVLVFPSVPGCGFGGLSTLGCRDLRTADGTVRGSWIWANYYFNPATVRSLLVHEMGHSLGVGHSRLLRFPGEALAADEARAMPLEYGDPTAVMGRSPMGDLAAAHKVELGWLDDASDVATAEEDGEFVLAPLGREYGTRALRVRRRGGAEEWLWLEHRGGQYPGVVVRRESPASGLATHILDMTPANLDESRTEAGLASEDSPDLQPGAIWMDPHSELRLEVGEAGEDGIRVRVQYEERCALPDGSEVVFREGELEKLVPVSSGEACEWGVATGSWWIGAERSEGGVVVRVGEPPDAHHRSGTLTIGRRQLKVRQLGQRRDTVVVRALPASGTLPVGWPAPFVVRLSDDNGTVDVETLSLRVRHGEEAGCYYRYSRTKGAWEASSDGTEFQESDSGVSGACTVQGSAIAAGPDEVVLRFTLAFAGAPGERLTVHAKVADAEGNAGDWLPVSELVAGEECRVLLTGEVWTMVAGGGAGQGLALRAPNGSCEWRAQTDAPWIRLRASEGSGEGTLPFDVEANRETTTREGWIEVNGERLRVVQFGNGEVQPAYVTLRPEETLVSEKGGVGVLTFFYGLGDLVPAEAEAEWLRVLGVVKNGDRREVSFFFDRNTEERQRAGGLRVGGKRFSVLQRAAPAAQ